ncbi:hypothetical protein SAMN05216593_11926, partial [Pseudomonas asturiensis]
RALILVGADLSANTVLQSLNIYRMYEPLREQAPVKIMR